MTKAYFFSSSFFISPPGAGAGVVGAVLVPPSGFGAGVGAVSGVGAGAGGGAGSDFLGAGGGAGLSPQPLRPSPPASKNARIIERYMFFFLYRLTS